MVSVLRTALTASINAARACLCARLSRGSDAICMATSCLLEQRLLAVLVKISKSPSTPTLDSYTVPRRGWMQGCKCCQHSAPLCDAICIAGMKILRSARRWWHRRACSTWAWEFQVVRRVLEMVSLASCSCILRTHSQHCNLSELRQLQDNMCTLYLGRVLTDAECTCRACGCVQGQSQSCISAADCA